jgi:5-methylthioadenosine/S-adenosylhomocysteine deaminase
MDIFAEMRLAALLQKPRLGAETMTATEVLRMATVDGAKALGLNAGSIEIGRQADLVVLDPDLPHSLGGGDPRSAIVYSMTPANVTDVFVGGQQVVADRAVVGWSTAETISSSKAALKGVRSRAGL